MATVEALFRFTSITQAVLRSYDYFTTVMVPRIVDTEIRVKSQLEDDGIEHVVKIHSPKFGEPCVVERNNETRVITSTEAKIRDLTYSVPLYAQIEYKVLTSDGEQSCKSYNNVFIGRVPLMVKSSLDTTQDDPRNQECSNCPGGYFIINGKEKTCVQQENIKTNICMTFSSRSRGIESVIYSQIDSITMQNATLKAYSKRGEIFFDINGQYPLKRAVIMKKIPLRYILAALGETVETLRDYICMGIDDDLEHMKICAFMDQSFDNPVEYRQSVDNPRHNTPASKIQRAWLRHVNRVPMLSARLFMTKMHTDWQSMMYPHDKSNASKNLLEQVKMLIYTHLGIREADSRDSERNKRVMAAGTLMSTLMGSLWNTWTMQLQKTIQKYVNSKKQLRMNKLCKNSSIYDGLKYALATGNWRGKDEQGGKTGVSQSLNRQTFISCVSQLRRVDSSIPSDSKIVDPRLLRGDSWGFRCCSETVEGGPCGLVTQLSTAARISVASEIEPIIRLIKNVRGKRTKCGTPVFVNGIYSGNVYHAKRVAKKLRYRRRVRTLPIDVSISIEDDKLLVFCDAGRIVRPVFIVRGVDEVGTSAEQDAEIRAGRMTWEDLLSSGIVEYIDAQETENCLIALQPCEVTPHHTHCEIDSSLILGVMANTVPFPEHDQSPRVIYQCAMGKQSVGLYSTNFRQRYDTNSNVLHYPQRPLTTTRINDLVAGDMPSGFNAIVAILCCGGYNQEDSVLVNQASLDRGMARLTNYRTFSASDIARGQKKHTFAKTDNPANRMIENDGLPIPNQSIEKGDVIIGRKVQSRDASVINTKNPGVIDDILVVQTDQGSQTVKVRLRQTRIPQVGDKFASRHGQKGTVGMIYREEDMPYTRDGIRPDIVISPMALPSRMTVAHTIEALSSKIAALSGNRQFATAFQHQDVYSFTEQLHALGYEKNGDEVMYDGRTGKKLEAKVFIAPTYYQRLKHMVEDKIYSRSNRGKVVSMTRQPAEGRSKGGGLRWGEMERDVGLSYGAAHVLNDRMLKSSDVYATPTCKRCGLVGVHIYSNRKDKCSHCGGEIDYVEMPYASKLMLQELMAMGVCPRLNTK